MTADIDKDNVAGIITETGGRTSHSAIIARALEIPAVLSVANATTLVKNGDMIVIDGSAGKVITSPDDHELEHYRAKAKQYAEEKAALEEYRGKPTITGDGKTKLLVANIGNPDDANVAAEHDCEGVGLFRSEFLFMDAKELPSEDEQFAAYQKVALRMKGKPVIIRTLDVGGDKEIPYLNLRHEDNPFMGFRAVRYCLNNPEQYKVQLTALLRASAFGDVKIMTSEKIVQVVDRHIIGGKIQEEYTFFDEPRKKHIPRLTDIPFYHDQVKIVLRNCGSIDCASIEEYISRDGYFGFAKAVKELGRVGTYEELIKSGLRGRGGAGFPTGIKWQSGHVRQRSTNASAPR